MSASDVDDHGQPFGLAFNANRRAERDISELLGLLKGILADGSVTAQEAAFVRDWITSHPDATRRWPVSAICDRVEAIFADGQVDANERDDLRQLFEGIVGGKVTMELRDQDGAAMPFDAPPPTIAWTGSLFVFTGQFAYGTRRTCEGEVLERGGRCAANVTRDADYLVIGTFGSRDWVHTSFGRKIQKAVEYRAKGLPLRIVGEDHWAASLA